MVTVYISLRTGIVTLSDPAPSNTNRIELTMPNGTHISTILAIINTIPGRIDPSGPDVIAVIIVA